jgi:hypothetical protein
MGCHWAFSQCHVAASYSTTSSTAPSSCHVSATSSYGCHITSNSPRHVTMPSRCHVTVQTVHTTTWKNPTGPWIGPEVPNTGDTWQPLVLPRHHVDVIMTCHLLTPATCVVWMLTHPYCC